MIRVTVELNGSLVDFDHPNADGFRVDNDGDVIVKDGSDVTAVYVNRVDRVVRVFDPTADEPRPADEAGSEPAAPTPLIDVDAVRALRPQS